ncbi:MAG TPA: phosphoenolpyruvate--protein phosphotransferase [Pseudomonadales bacterium]
MLRTLRSVVQEVNAVHDLQTALDIIVTRVRDAMDTHVCSVYIHEPSIDRLVFMATEGLNKAAQGKISLGMDEGLVGLVARREEPVNLDDAESHPNFRYLKGIGEDPFKSFLGVPIVHHREVLGVLVIQQKDQRRFDESEEAFLITMSAQLAGVIAHARATGAVRSPIRPDGSGATFGGIAGAGGIAIGDAVVVYPPAELKGVPSKKITAPAKEITRLKKAVEQVRKDIRTLSKRLSDRLAIEEQALFDVYLSMLDDNALVAEVVEVIREQKQWAQGALSQVMLEHVRTFESMDDEYLRERAVDVKDLGRRVLAALQQADQTQREYPAATVLVSEELTASMLGEIPRENLVGLVSIKGSRNSHVAILARSMGIPTVMGASELPYSDIDGQPVIIDGYSGEVHTHPAAELRQHYEQIFEEEKLVTRGLEELRDVPCITTDGHRVPLLVNTGLMSDIARSIDNGAEGVGLYRTEIPFLMQDRFPSEEEQRVIYRKQLEAFAPLPVTMRTLDIGGDKALPYFPIEEDNPFLGWRGIRVTLDHPEIFLGQVRAMMKASVGLNNLRIMLPMISSVPELEEALELVYRAHDELIEDGLEIPLPPMGVMVEVPSAVYQARDLARRVDFLSVGSNDLTQYLLAVDRNNARVANLYHAYHPAVLRALRDVAQAAHKEGKQVSICGELAGDPGAALLLLAMGYDSLSMNATNLLRVKAVVRFFSQDKAEKLLKKVLKFDNARDIHEALDEALSAAGITRLLRSTPEAR